MMPLARLLSCIFGGPEKGPLVGGGYFTAPPLAGWLGLLAAEAVEGAALALEGVDHVHGGDGLPLGMLGVGDGVLYHEGGRRRPVDV